MRSSHVTARRLAATALLVGVATACGGGSGASSRPVIVLSAHPGATSGDIAVPRVVTLHVSSARGIGEHLVANGRTLYMYPPDQRGAVTCTAKRACDTAWPPLFVPSGDRVRAGVGLRQSLVGTIRGDGGTIVTYNRWPLYFYIGDRKPGQLNGQGQGFDWYVVGPDGHPIRRNLS
jgi:predicted lipoprotein with Yx(FWY)xxD motif